MTRKEIVDAYYEWAKTHRAIACLMRSPLELLRPVSPDVYYHIYNLLTIGKDHVAIIECLMDYHDQHPKMPATYTQDLITELNKL